MKDQTTGQDDSGKGHYFLGMNGSVPMEGLFVRTACINTRQGEIVPVFGAHWIYSDFEQDLLCKCQQSDKTACCLMRMSLNNFDDKWLSVSNRILDFAPTCFIGWVCNC